MNLEQIKKLKIPQKPGCYQYFNRTGKIIYIGKAANLKSRVLSYWQKSAEHSPAKWVMMKRIERIEWIETDSEIEALLLEANLVKKYQPEFNVLLRDDKRFCYIKVSLEDEIPGVFITRKLDRAGKYFGPFVSAIAVRETVKAIRKIWPYCTERTVKAKPCFYAQIGRCLGVCGGLVNRKEYMEKVIKPIILFLEGEKQLIINNYELRIKKLEKEIKKEKNPGKIEEFAQDFGRLKFQLGNMKNVLAHTNILGLVDKYAADVVELAKLLGLPRVPRRIEGYDVSNMFGKEAVGSMVVFTDGEPDKNEYRKFKIRIGSSYAEASEDKQGQLTNQAIEKRGDVQMLKEVMERRFGNDWPLPDLIIIDGGKGQANIVAAVLKKQKLEIPVIAISKGNGLRSAMAPDKLFFPGEKKPLQLSLASPAMHLIKRVRDEAHRFAISYHRHLRSKRVYMK